MLHRHFQLLSSVCVAVAVLSISLAGAQEVSPPGHESVAVVAGDASAADAASSATAEAVVAPPNALQKILNFLTLSPGWLSGALSSPSHSNEAAEILPPDPLGEEASTDTMTATAPPGSGEVEEVTAAGDAAENSAEEAENQAAADPPEPAPLPKYGPHNPRQVLVSATILEWTHSNSLDWGFSLLYFADESNQSEIFRAADATFPKPSALNDGLKIFLDNIDRNNGAGGFEVVIDMLEQNGNVHILNEPSIVMANAGDQEPGVTVAPAEIKTTSEFPYEQAAAIGGVLAKMTAFKDAGISLKVSDLMIMSDDFIRMKIDAIVTDYASQVTVAINNDGDPISVPTRNMRKISNTVLVRNDFIFIAGILITTKTFDSNQGIPILSRIPILKYFTSNKHKNDEVQELIFLIKPRILQIPGDDLITNGLDRDYLDRDY